MRPNTHFDIFVSREVRLENGEARSMTVTQICSSERCANTAAFKTRSKPAWCTDCIEDILREGGLTGEESFTAPNDWRLTTCLTCGVKAHYKFSYTLEKNSQLEKTCRACHWMEWAKRARQLSGSATPGRIYSQADITARLDQHGYDLMATIVDFNDGNDPVVARCRSCNRISAERLADISWGCSCSRNARSTTPTALTGSSAAVRNIRTTNPASSKTGRLLLADSEDAALRWWDHERNDEKTFRTVTLRATRTCHWVCPECSLSFPAKVLDMTAGRSSCPDCSKIRAAEWAKQYAKYKVTPVSDVPDLSAAWADDADPRRVMVAGGPLRRFSCPAGHHPRISPLTFLESGCPSCSAAETRKTQKNWLSVTLPEIASQWHPKRNGKLSPSCVVWDSKKVVWWKADCCGYVWEASPRSRDKYQRLRCPMCKSILGSLAWQDPGLAGEWSPSNPQTPWQVRPYAATQFVPGWICATNPDHRWEGPLAGRSNGAECPECKVVGKSKVELAHLAAAKDLFSGVRSGRVLRDPAFKTRRSWTADISASVDGRLLIIEYDGAYWHSAAAKVLTDERKTVDLLAAGYHVVRLREDDLPSLAVTHRHYSEIRVYSTAPRPQATMLEVQKWLAGSIMRGGSLSSWPSHKL